MRPNVPVERPRNADERVPRVRLRSSGARPHCYGSGSRSAPTIVRRCISLATATMPPSDEFEPESNEVAQCRNGDERPYLTGTGRPDPRHETRQSDPRRQAESGAPAQSEAAKRVREHLTEDFYHRVEPSVRRMSKSGTDCVCRLTYQLSGRPTKMNVCPACACAAVAHARTATEAAHGPLQRKLEVTPPPRRV
jgi:hypothetical protein